jgi:hypothetical protein
MTKPHEMQERDKKAFKRFSCVSRAKYKNKPGIFKIPGL